MTTEPITSDYPRRKALKMSVAAVCADAGFQSADEGSLETLTEMLQSFITEIGRSSRSYSELSGRTVPMLSDIILALIEMGFDVQSLPAFAKKGGKFLILPPNQMPPTSQSRSLQTGQKYDHAGHIPDYLPAFPDPHTYIKSETYKEPVTQYQVIREKAASQKRDVERALTRFIAKTGETECLFQDDPYAYPLIADKPRALPYLDALLCKEEDLSIEEEDQKSTVQRSSPRKSEKSGEVDLNTSQESQTSRHSLDNTSGEIDSETQIDNPYLRTIKMPKFKTTGKKHKW